MRKLNKQIIVLVLLLPMLVMLAHDIIPHHHHETPTTTNYVKMNHAHLKAEHSHCTDHHHQTQHLGHSHENHETECCSFSNLRFFKNFKFQVFITHVILDMLVPKDFTPKKYYVSNFILIPEPKREAYGLRGPPLV